MGAGAAVVVRWSPEQQISRKFIEEAIEVMDPNKLIAGSGSGWMGGAGDQAETGCVRASELWKCYFSLFS